LLRGRYPAKVVYAIGKNYNIYIIIIIILQYSVYMENFVGVFESRVESRIFRPKRDEVTGEWRILRNEELHNVYSSPSIIKMINSSRRKLARLIARMGRSRMLI
jgi:hypothetical protein